MEIGPPILRMWKVVKNYFLLRLEHLPLVTPVLLQKPDGFLFSYPGCC